MSTGDVETAPCTSPCRTPISSAPNLSVQLLVGPCIHPPEARQWGVPGRLCVLPGSPCCLDKWAGASLSFYQTLTQLSPPGLGFEPHTPPNTQGASREGSAPPRSLATLPSRGTGHHCAFPMHTRQEGWTSYQSPNYTYATRTCHTLFVSFTLKLANTS